MRKIIGLSFAALMLTCVLLGQERPSLSNAQVIEMVRSGLGESVIATAIADSRPNFDLSANGLVALKKANVSDRLIAAMQDAVIRARAPGSTRGQPVPPMGLTRELAAALLNRSSQFNHTVEVSLRPGRQCEEVLTQAQKWERAGLSYSDPELDQIDEQSSAGLVALQRLGFIETTRAQPNPSECRTANAVVRVVRVTSLGDSEIASGRWPSRTDGWRRIVLSRVTLGQVTGLAIDGAQASVDFTWKWMPVYGKPTVPNTPRSLISGAAILRRYDDGWRLTDAGLFRFAFRDATGVHRGVVDYGVDVTLTTPTTAASKTGSPLVSSDVDDGKAAKAGSDPTANRQLAEVYAQEGRYTAAVRPAQLALTAGHALRFRIRHHHAVSFGNPYCEGDLEVDGRGVSFRSSNAGHSFEHAVVRGAAALADAEGRVEIAVEVGSDKVQSRNIAFWVKAAAPRKGYRSLECSGCLPEARGLAQLLELAKAK
jgi:hypothetical protein